MQTTALVPNPKPKHYQFMPNQSINKLKLNPNQIRIFTLKPSFAPNSSVFPKLSSLSRSKNQTALTKVEVEEHKNTENRRQNQANNSKKV